MQEILIDSPADPTSATTHRSHPCPQRLLPPDSAARSARNRRSTNAIRGSCRADDGEPASPHTGIRLPCHQVLLSPTPALSSPLLPASSSSSPLDSESDDCSSGMTTLLRYRTYDKALACSSATPFTTPQPQSMHLGSLRLQCQRIQWPPFVFGSDRLETEALLLHPLDHLPRCFARAR